MTIKKHIPNLITCGNLFCGCLGIVFAFEGKMVISTYFLWLALLLDFFDGFFARLLKVSSPIGKELDSLADVVTFGVLPSVIMFHLIRQNTDLWWLPYMAFLIAVFSALRLAKFNIDERQHTTFIGLPTPANALFISSLVFFATSPYAVYINLTTLLVITVGFSLLLVAPVELFALKFKSFSWKENSIRFIFIIISVLSVIALQILAIPIIIIAYIALSIFDKATSK